LQAVVEFTGSPLPEENRTVALLKLSFFRKAPGTQRNWSSRPIALGEIPSVLLSECWNDLRTMARAGSGFDPQWEKKSEY
jgi:hypothetical protein